jgi:hypothetical protein
MIPCSLVVEYHRIGFASVTGEDLRFVSMYFHFQRYHEDRGFSFVP